MCVALSSAPAASSMVANAPHGLAMRRRGTAWHTLRTVRPARRTSDRSRIASRNVCTALQGAMISAKSVGHLFVLNSPVRRACESTAAVGLPRNHLTRSRVDESCVAPPRLLQERGQERMPSAQPRRIGIFALMAQ